MLVKVLFLFVLFGIFASNLHCVNGGRGHFSNSGRGKSSTSHRTYSSHSSRSNKPSWFSWFRSNKNVAASSPTTTAQKSTSPTFNHRSSAIPMQSRMGFSAYGNNYQSNFHHNPPYHFQPISQPYQSHFRPQTTTDVFAYHFMPYMPYTHVHHVHHYSTNDPVYYDYRNASATTSTAQPRTEPIVYDFKPPAQNRSSFASSEEIEQTESINSNDYFIAGVENLLFYGMMKENQHQVIFTMQGSDGVSYETELLSIYERNDKIVANDINLQYFPDVEFRFVAGDEPTDDDLTNISEMYRKLIEYGSC